MNSAWRFGRKIFFQAWKRFHSATVPFLMPRGYSPGPTNIHIQLTYKCNLRCSFCGQWGDKGNFKSLPAQQLRQLLPLSVLKSVIDDLPFTCELVGLWGGETLDYPDLIPLVRHIKDRGRACSLVTNGTSLAKHASRLVEAGIDVIEVSLDGIEASHDAARGARGSFRAALEGIHAVRSERSARNLRSPKISVGAVLLPATINDMPALVRQLRAEGVNWVTFNRLQYTTEQQGNSHAAVFQKLFQITAGSWKGFMHQPEAGSPEKVKAIVEQLHADPENKDFIVWGERTWSPQDFFNYYTNSAAAAPAGRSCRFPWDAVSLCANGDVTPCPDYPDFVAGNVNQQSFREIWNGPRMREFRAKLAEHGRFPVCTSCCHLYD